MTDENENIIQSLADKFGGVRRLAVLLDLSEQTIYSWKRVGIIPAKYHIGIMSDAKARGITITTKDFYKKSDLEKVAQIKAGGHGN